MLDLVDQLAGPLSLGDRPPGDQAGQDRVEPLGGQSGERGEVGQRKRTAGHGQHVQDRPRDRVGAAGPRGHPFGQALGQSVTRGGEIRVLLEQPTDQADDVQRIAPRTLPNPIDERRSGRLPDDRLGQFPHRVPVQRDHLEAPQEAVLVELEQRLRRDLLPGQVAGPAGSHDQQPRVVKVPGEVPQRLP